MDLLTFLRGQWERVAGAMLAGAGGLVLILAAAQARQALYVPDSLAAVMSGGVVALGFGLAGAAFLVSAELHDSWRRLDRLERRPVPANSAVENLRAGGAGWATILGLWLRCEADRVAAWALLAGGFGALALGSQQVRLSLHPAEQVAFMVSAGIGGLFLIVVASALRLGADLRDQRNKLGRFPAAAGEVRPGRGPALVALVAGGAGGVLMVLGWHRASEALTYGPATDGALLASIGLGVVVFGLVVAGATLHRRIERTTVLVLRSLIETDVRDQETPEAPADSEAVAGHWSGAGLGYFHRASCPVVLGLDPAKRQRLGTHDRDALHPCGLCEPAVADNPPETALVSLTGCGERG
jgi:hypothetical protein